jgi:hypothetical protein
MTMKKLTTRLMIATASLVVAAGAASAQIRTTMTAQIPFEFRAGNRVMEPGTYRIDNVSIRTSGPMFRLLNVNSGGSAILTVQALVDPQKGWTEESSKLVFACTSGSCALAQLWNGPASQACKFYAPKLGKDETAYLREIPMQRGKGE